MGKKNRQERRAERKENRAERKEARAEKLAEKGKTERADKLIKRADELTQKAQELKEKAALTKGCVATLYDLNSAGGCYMKVTWNYEGGDQSPRYDHHEISIASSSPFRKQGMGFRDISASQFEWTTPSAIPNINYVVKVNGVSGSKEELIGRCIAKKIT
jgi:hypothetical protein